MCNSKANWASMNKLHIDYGVEDNKRWDWHMQFEWWFLRHIQDQWVNFDPWGMVIKTIQYVPIRLRISLFKPSNCSESNGGWKFTFPTIDGNSRIPIPFFLKEMKSFAWTNEIKVIFFTIYIDGLSLFNPKFNDVQTLWLQGRTGNEAERYQRCRRQKHLERNRTRKDRLNHTCVKICNPTRAYSIYIALHY